MRKPLLGKKILVTRAEGQAESFAARLRALGAEPIILPTIVLVPPQDWEPVDQAIHQLESYHWLIFTSANGVRFFLERLQALGYKPRHLEQVHKAAIGPATASALEQHGLPVDFVPAQYLAEAIAEGLGDKVRGQRILLPRADIARKDLSRLLRARGAHVEEVIAYRTQPAPLKPAQLQGLFQKKPDIITFTSASTARHFAGLLQGSQELLRGVTVACIGPITARVAGEAGLPVHIVAREHTLEGLITAIAQEETDHHATDSIHSIQPTSA